MIHRPHRAHACEVGSSFSLQSPLTSVGVKETANKLQVSEKSDMSLNTTCISGEENIIIAISTKAPSSSPDCRTMISNFT